MVRESSMWLIFLASSADDAVGKRRRDARLRSNLPPSRRLRRVRSPPPQPSQPTSTRARSTPPPRPNPLRSRSTTTTTTAKTSSRMYIYKSVRRLPSPEGNRSRRRQPLSHVPSRLNCKENHQKKVNGSQTIKTIPTLTLYPKTRIIIRANHIRTVGRFRFQRSELLFEETFHH